MTIIPHSAAFADSAISCGEVKSGTISTPPQQDTYTFSGNSGDAVVITAKTTSGAMLAVADLRSPSSTLIATTGVAAATSSVVLPVTGNYTIVVYDFMLDQTGTYDVGLQFTTGRCAASISCGQTASGTTASIVKRDAYTFTGNSGEAVIVTTKATSGTMLAVADLYDSAGTLIGTTGVAAGTSSIVLPETDDYTIVVYDHMFDGTGAYNLNLQFTTGRCAGPISCGQTVSGPIGSIAKRDTYNFTGNSGEAVILSTKATSGSLLPVADLYGPTGTLVGTTGVVPASSSLVLPATGNYTVVVYDHMFDTTGSYDLNLQFTTGRCAALWSCGKTGSGTLVSTAQQDTFKFRGNSCGQAILSAMATSGTMQARVDLYDPSGTLIGSNGVGNSSTASLHLTSAGFYTIMAYDFMHDGTGTYNAGVRCNKPTLTDFDGDFTSDFTVYRPLTGIWYSLNLQGSYKATQWGVSSDDPVPGDYDGDGIDDIAVWRSEGGVWYILPSSIPSSYTQTQWGISSDHPLTGDYDGDGKADIAVWRPESGIWYILPSGTPSSYKAVQWGMADDIPVPGDYDGDGKTDIAVWRPASGIWYIIPSAAPTTYIATQWGASDDKVVPGDYDGDGKTDIAVWRSASGIWYIIPSAAPTTYIATQWGVSDDKVVPADYDGDGKTDIAVWRAEGGIWFTTPSGSPSTYTATQWGISTDKPISPAR